MTLGSVLNLLKVGYSAMQGSRKYLFDLISTCLSTAQSVLFMLSLGFAFDHVKCCNASSGFDGYGNFGLNNI